MSIGGIENQSSEAWMFALNKFQELSKEVKEEIGILIKTKEMLIGTKNSFLIFKSNWKKI